MIDDESEIPRAGRGRLLALRLVATCFGVLGGITGLVGAYWVLQAFWSGRRTEAASGGPAEMVETLIVPIVVMVAGTWFFYRIGRGLRQRSRAARWAAVGLLVPACVPPLTLFFLAIRGGILVGAALALMLLIPPASGSLLLTSWKTDTLFRAEKAALSEESRPSNSVEGMVLKMVLLAFALVLTLALVAISQ